MNDYQHKPQKKTGTTVRFFCFNQNNEKIYTETTKTIFCKLPDVHFQPNGPKDRHCF